MTVEQFREQIGRLASQWPNTYKQERAALIWRELEQLPAAAFRAMVDSALANSMKAPLLPEFQAAKARYLQAQRASEAVNSVGGYVAEYRCVLCRDLGVLYCRREEVGGVWAFRCLCDKGRMASCAFPVYREQHGYTPVGGA